MIRSWIRLGAVAGIVASLALPLAQFIPVPVPAQVWIVSVFGVAISLSSIGLYHLLAINQ